MQILPLGSRISAFYCRWCNDEDRPMISQLPQGIGVVQTQIIRGRPIKQKAVNASGFTLVEILVVMVIVGIMAGMVVLSVGGNPQRTLQKEARRLAVVIRTAADEALLQGREFGLRINPNSYQVLEFDQQQRNWKSSEQKVFAEHQLPDAMSLAVMLEDEPVDLRSSTTDEKDKNKKNNSDAEETPIILFFSNGEGMAYSISLHHKDVEGDTSLITDGVEDVQLVRP